MFWIIYIIISFILVILGTVVFRFALNRKNSKLREISVSERVFKAQTPRIQKRTRIKTGNMKYDNAARLNSYTAERNREMINNMTYMQMWENMKK